MVGFCVGYFDQEGETEKGRQFKRGCLGYGFRKYRLGIWLPTFQTPTQKEIFNSSSWARPT